MFVIEEVQAFASVPRRPRTPSGFVIPLAVSVIAATLFAAPHTSAGPVDPPSDASLITATPPAASLAPRVAEPPAAAGFASREDALAAREAFRAWRAARPRPKRARATRGTPGVADITGTAAATAPPPIDAHTLAALTSDPQHVLAGHLLRRAGFGPSPKDMKKVLKVGTVKWIEQQLDPKKINDGHAITLMGKSPAADEEEDHDWIARWYVRMTAPRAASSSRR